jgi:predicted RNA binding protein YcfA (HicA-like mRNA interferase family)
LTKSKLFYTFDYGNCERVMKWSELKKKLKNAGYVFLRDAKGSHEIWHHPDKEGSEIVIANHASKEVGTGLANKILKQAELK